MCRMWESIRTGVRFVPKERMSLSSRGLNMTRVRRLDLAFDPTDAQAQSLREFWFNVTTARIRATNPALRVTTDLGTDRRAPTFTATLDDGRRLIFRTARMPVADLQARLNVLLGNPPLGKAGLRPPPSQQQQQKPEEPVKDSKTAASKKKKK